LWLWSAFSGAARLPGREIRFGVDRPSLLSTESVVENPAPQSGELVRCQINHDVYACSDGGVAMLGGNGMDIIS
jgi:hypothetical protein